MQDIKASKKAMRSTFLDSRENTSQEQRQAWSSAINTNLVEHLSTQSLTRVKLYVPFRSEVNIWTTIHWCLKHNIQALAPKCNQNTKEMHWYQVRGEADFIVGAYGILEPNPASCELILQEASHVIVPGVAFTKDGKRLGYGGGYYDRFYEKANAHVYQWIGVGYEMQMADDIPTDEHDMYCHLIVTNEGIHYRDIEGERK